MDNFIHHRLRFTEYISKNKLLTLIYSTTTHLLPGIEKNMRRYTCEDYNTEYNNEISMIIDIYDISIDLWNILYTLYCGILDTDTEKVLLKDLKEVSISLNVTKTAQITVDIWYYERIKEDNHV